MRRRVPAALAILVIGITLLVPGLVAMRLYSLLRAEEGPEAVAPFQPFVQESDFAFYDLASLKAGDWVEYDVFTSSQYDDSTLSHTRFACVSRSADTVRIESCDATTARFFPDRIILCDVDLESRLVRHAWWGTPGSRPSSIPVIRADRTDSPGPRTSCFADASPDPIRVADRTLQCERIAMQRGPANLALNGQTVSWVCPEVPFQLRLSDPRSDDPITWIQRPAAHGGMVRESYTGYAVKTVTRLTAWGRDARSQLLDP